MGDFLGDLFSIMTGYPETSELLDRLTIQIEISK